MLSKLELLKECLESRTLDARFRSLVYSARDIAAKKISTISKYHALEKGLQETRNHISSKSFQYNRSI